MKNSSKKSKVKKKKEIKLDVFEELSNGNVPEELVIIYWEDITQYESCELGVPTPLTNICSCGIIAYADKNKVDLQQSWWVKDNSPVQLSNMANLSLSLPVGVIKKLHKYKLVETKEF